MDNFIELLEKDYDESSENLKEDNIDAISSGSISLDVSTGIGGYPKGRFSLLYGAESSGKTTMALQACREALLNGNKVLYIDVEQTLDIGYAKKIFGDVPIDENGNVINFYLAHPVVSEDALEIAELAIIGNKRKGIKPKEFDLIILDSVGALSPEKEREDDLRDTNVALVARNITKFLRRTAGYVRKYNIAFIFIGQVRASIGTFQKGYTVTGGHALLHYIVLSIMFSKVATLKDDKSKEPYGIAVKFIVKKNKISIPYRSGEFNILFNHGVDYYRDLIDLSVLFNFMKKNGAFYYYNDTQLGQGMDKAKEYLGEHQEIVEELENKCLEALDKVR